MASSPGANGTSSLPSRTTTYSPSDRLPIRRMLPRVPAGTAAEAARTPTRGFSPAWTRERSESMSASVSFGSAGLAFLRGGTAKDYDGQARAALRLMLLASGGPAVQISRDEAPLQPRR